MSPTIPFLSIIWVLDQGESWTRAKRQQKQDTICRSATAGDISNGLSSRFARNPLSHRSWYAGTTPQAIVGGRKVGDSIDIVKAIDDLFPSKESRLYPPGLDVDGTINKFKDIFPSYTRPSSRAAYLFRSSGSPVERSAFESTLDKTNSLIAETPGRFFLGENLTAADIAWAPFLER